MLKFCMKVYNISYFPDRTMDLVYILYDDRYKSEVLFQPLQRGHGLYWGGFVGMGRVGVGVGLFLYHK